MKKMMALLLVLLFLPVLAFADLEVYFLDVGQGDSAIVLCDGESMIIDGGPASASSFLYSFIRDTLGLEHIDYMVATHPHEDHIGGLPAVLNAVPVDLILSPVSEWDTKRFESISKYAQAQGAQIIVPDEGDMLSLGSATVMVLHCWPDAWTVNDMSIVVRIDYGQTSFLFTGDAEYSSEYMMIDAQFPLKADVLKAGHHGSYTSSSYEFLESVQPNYVIISCGTENGYGHPHQETLDKLKNVEIYRTDLQGTIHCISDGKTIRFTTERTASGDLYMSPAQVKENEPLEDGGTEINSTLQSIFSEGASE